MDLIDALPRYDSVPLENAPLTLTVAQVRFPVNMAIPTDDSLLARFQGQIRNFYPVLSVGHARRPSEPPDASRAETKGDPPTSR